MHWTLEDVRALSLDEYEVLITMFTDAHKEKD